MDLVGIEAINGICEAETINDCKVHSFDLDIDFSSLYHTSKVSEQDMSLIGTLFETRYSINMLPLVLVMLIQNIITL